MRAKEFLDELRIDNEHGWGQTPNNANVDYKGLKVMMKPSIFLRLSAELPTALVTIVNIRNIIYAVSITLSV